MLYAVSLLLAVMSCLLGGLQLITFHLHPDAVETLEEGGHFLPIAGGLQIFFLAFSFGQTHRIFKRQSEEGQAST